MNNELPDHLFELLERRVDTFEKLEVLVALHGEPRATSSVEALCRMLKLPRDVIREAVMELRSSSLVELTSRGEVQLLPPSQKDAASVAELVAMYRDDRMVIVRTIGEIAMMRVRSMTAKVFADAFVIRKKPPKDGEDG